MSGEEVSVWREVGVAEAVEPGLFGGGESEGEDQRIARWLELTRVILPGMAVDEEWPIRLDHCFMRVLLDHTIGGVWHRVVKRPAIRHLTRAQLERAIGLGEQVVADPGRMPGMNRASLAWRRADRVYGTL